MSRVGKHPVVIPDGITVKNDGNNLTVSKGALNEIYGVPDCINMNISDSRIALTPQNDKQDTIALWGTTQRNIFNIIYGMDKGFKIDLELVGVGYKAAVQGKKLVLQLGYSHDIEYNIPENVSIVCSKPTSISISGHSKKVIGDVAAKLRSYRKPEPYKGKGVMKVGEFIYRKEGKKK